MMPYGNKIWVNIGSDDKSTLVQVMALCYVAQSHYLNQCWLIIDRVLWHSPESNFITSMININPKHVLRDYIFKLSATSTRVQRVKVAMTSGVGVTKPIFSVPLFSTFSVIVKTNVSYWISCLYLAGVTAAKLRRHLSNMNVIRKI